MVRTGVGISKLSVNQEIDPGFGPDTEQRRVDFAAKLEKEAFSIAIGDSLEIAKANLITALKLWESNHLIKYVSDLKLRDIMIIWYVFKLIYLFRVISIMEESSLKIVLDDDSNVKEFWIKILKPLYKDIQKYLRKKGISINDLKDMRMMFGGPLIFSLNHKNKEELEKLYQMTQSKLPKSLRDEFKIEIKGLVLKYNTILNTLKDDCSIKKIAGIVMKHLRKFNIYKKKDLTRFSEFFSAFDGEFSKLCKSMIDEKNTEYGDTTGDVEKRVKRFYGIK